MLKSRHTLLLFGSLSCLSSCNCNQAKITALNQEIYKNQDDSSHLVRQNHLEERAIAGIKVQMDSLDAIDQSLKDSTRQVYNLSPLASEYIYGQHNNPPITLRDIIELDSAKIIRPFLKLGFQWTYGKCCQFIADTVARHYKRLDVLKKASQDKRDFFQKQITTHKNTMTDNRDKIDSLGKVINRQRENIQDLK